MQALETARCRLRPLTVADLDSYHRQISNDMRVMEYIPPHTIAPRRHTQRLLKDAERHWRQYGYGLYAVVYQEHAKLIGHAGLQRSKLVEALLLDIVLNANYWSRGLGKEIGKRLLALGFEELGAEQISALIEAHNHPAQRILTHLGLAWVGQVSTPSRLLQHYRIDQIDFVAEP